MELSDFPRLFIIGVSSSTSRHGLHFSLLQTEVGSPSSRAGWFLHAWGLRPRRRQVRLAMAVHPMLPSAYFESVSTLKGPLLSQQGHDFAAQYPAACAFPLSTLQRRPFKQLRMSRGRFSPLHLQRMSLSLTPPCRFVPAHRNLMKITWGWIATAWSGEVEISMET